MTRSAAADVDFAEARDELRPLSQDDGMEDLSVSDGMYRPIVRYGLAEHMGGRNRMEDMLLVVEDVGTSMDYGAQASPRAFFGVFDGHGGRDAAEYVHTYLLRNILGDAEFPLNLHDAYRRAFIKTDLDFSRECATGNLAHSGTTATTALLWGRKLSVANLGDCRAVLCQRGKAMELTGDQKPTTTHERQRIIDAGGFVDQEGFLNGVLGVSRALGDWNYEDLKPPGPKAGPLSSIPEVTEWELTQEDEFMVIACDGLWDVFSSQNAVEYARGELRRHNDPVKCSEALIQEALRRNTCDNVSAIVVCFSTLPPPRRQYGGPGLNRSLSANAFSNLQDALNVSMEHNTGADRILL